jgi:hypothetical protein
VLFGSVLAIVAMAIASTLPLGGVQ